VAYCPANRSEIRLRRLLLVAVSFAAFGAASQALAATPECDAAVYRFTAAVSGVSDKLQHYSLCLSSTTGREDCSLDFRFLRSSQTAFEEAVAGVRRACP
jgi:hypothetical protein